MFPAFSLKVLAVLCLEALYEKLSVVSIVFPYHWLERLPRAAYILPISILTYIAMCITDM